MNDSVTRNYKIKAISFFFEARYNEKLSEKVLSIINNYTLEYTVNNNGIFINLNVLDDSILDMIHYVVKEYEKEISIDGSINEGVYHDCQPYIDYGDSFIQKKDNIKSNKVDDYLLQLSTRLLTI